MVEKLGNTIDFYFSSTRDTKAAKRCFGKTLAAFGYLENTLTSACVSLTTPPADPASIRPDQVEAYIDWYAKL